jgi:hypothetical protein
MNGNGVTRDAVLSHLERVLSSAQFRQAERSAGLLRYLVERSLNGADDRVKEYTVGIEFLGRLGRARVGHGVRPAAHRQQRNDANCGGSRESTAMGEKRHAIVLHDPR